jgi:predicted GNAT family acetyltransferase
MAAPPPASASAVVWDAAKLRFATPDGVAYLQYALKSEEESAMDIVHTFVPPSKRGLGIAALLCDAAFRHAKQHGFSVIPTCTYVSVCNQRAPALLTTTVGRGDVVHGMHLCAVCCVRFAAQQIHRHAPMQYRDVHMHMRIPVRRCAYHMWRASALRNQRDSCSLPHVAVVFGSCVRSLDLAVVKLLYLELFSLSAGCKSLVRFYLWLP